MKKMIAMVMSIIMLFTIIPETKVQAACAHDWEEWEVLIKPTCDTDGYATRMCRKCYDMEDKNIPATGIHVWTEWKADGYLCKDGKYERYCKECYKKEAIPRQGDGNHIYSDWSVISKPDCVNDGKKI